VFVVGHGRKLRVKQTSACGAAGLPVAIAIKVRAREGSMLKDDPARRGLYPNRTFAT